VIGKNFLVNREKRVREKPLQENEMIVIDLNGN